MCRFFLHAKYILSVCFFVMLPCLAFAGAGDLRSSYPYITGNTFRAFCDHIIDDYVTNLIPENVEYGDTIFVKTEFLHLFFTRFHPKIANAYILVTHNSDYQSPGPYGEYLDNPKLIAWFAQNVENASHPKLHPIPIGIANRCWWHGSIETLHRLLKVRELVTKKILLYLNVNSETYPGERGHVFEKFSPLSFCKSSGFSTEGGYIAWGNYLLELAESHFVLSPRGNGLDCHRTWETLYMGSIPILRSSSSDSMFDGLPVIIINDWEEVTFDFLLRKLKEMGGLKYSREKLFADYWFDLINSYKTQKRIE